MRLHAPSVRLNQPGEDVPKSGIYRVTHYRHHHDHEVTCISGEPFPECRECKDRARFALMIAAHAVDRHMHFHQGPEELLAPLGEVRQQQPH